MSPAQRIKQWSPAFRWITGLTSAVVGGCLVIGIVYIARGSSQAFQNQDALCKVESSVQEVNAKTEKNREAIGAVDRHHREAVSEMGKDIAGMRSDITWMKDGIKELLRGMRQQRRDP